MKAIITATLALVLVSSLNVPANAKAHHKAEKKQIAMTLQGGTTKEATFDKKTAEQGLSSDFTSEWSGGCGDQIIVGGGSGG